MQIYIQINFVYNLVKSNIWSSNIRIYYLLLITILLSSILARIEIKFLVLNFERTPFSWCKIFLYIHHWWLQLSTPTTLILWPARSVNFWNTAAAHSAVAAPSARSLASVSKLRRTQIWRWSRFWDLGMKTIGIKSSMRFQTFKS